MTYDVDRIRARIPALADGTAYFDGPGGTGRKCAPRKKATFTYLSKQ